MKKPILAPSVLSCDFTKMGEQITAVESVGCSFLHIDVMDGIFVPNISIGQPVLKSLRAFTGSVLDTHLMITKPERYIDSFIAAGADSITIHLESTDNAADVLRYIKSKDKRCAVSIKPKTDPKLLTNILPICDMVLIMTVEPGFGGQKLIPEALDNIRAVHKMSLDLGLEIDIEVDGGIDLTTLGDAVSAGANILVAGSAIFGSSDITASYLALEAAMLKQYNSLDV